MYGLSKSVRSKRKELHGVSCGTSVAQTDNDNEGNCGIARAEL